MADTTITHDEIRAEIQDLRGAPLDLALAHDVAKVRAISDLLDSLDELDAADVAADKAAKAAEARAAAEAEAHKVGGLQLDLWEAQCAVDDAAALYQAAIDARLTAVATWEAATPKASIRKLAAALGCSRWLADDLLRESGARNTDPRPGRVPARRRDDD